MKTILLAVDGMTPDKNALDYALNLCNPIRAGLDILQIIRPLGSLSILSKIKKGVSRTRDMVEDAMVTATYAQAGAPELAETLQAKAERRLKRLIPTGINTAMDYHCIVTTKDPDFVLKNYLDEHRNVILAIYDSIRLASASKSSKVLQKSALSSVLDKLTIPLVFVRDMKPGSL
jgi:hypothetical protein